MFRKSYAGFFDDCRTKARSLVFQKLFNNWTDFLPHPGLNGARSPLVRSSAARCTILRSDCRFSDNEHRCEGLALAPKTPKDAASPRHLYFGKTFEGELHGCGTTSSALRSGRSRSCRFVEDSLKERKRSSRLSRPQTRLCWLPGLRKPSHFGPDRREMKLRHSCEMRVVSVF